MSLLAGVGLGIAVVNMVALTPVLAINNAIETYVSMATSMRGGARSEMNQARLLSIVFLIPGVIVLCFTQKILVALN